MKLGLLKRAAANAIVLPLVALLSHGVLSYILVPLYALFIGYLGISLHNSEKQFKGGHPLGAMVLLGFLFAVVPTTAIITQAVLDLKKFHPMYFLYALQWITLYGTIYTVFLWVACLSYGFFKRGRQQGFTQTIL